MSHVMQSEGTYKEGEGRRFMFYANPATIRLYHGRRLHMQKKTVCLRRERNPEETALEVLVTRISRCAIGLPEGTYNSFCAAKSNK